MIYRSGTLLGRLLSGLQSDMGTLAHAVVRKPVKSRPCPYNDWGRNAERMAEKVTADISLCGRRPDKRSVGWTFGNQPITCPKCLSKLAKESV